jgi:hypothetical protein
MQCAILNHFTTHEYMPTEGKQGTDVTSGRNIFYSTPGSIRTIFDDVLNDPK